MARIRGVALVVTNPRSEILMLQEFEDKPHIGKLRGMFSIPMETSREGETQIDTVKRLPHEELPGLQLQQLPGAYIGAYCVVPNVWVTLYTVATESFDLPAESECSEVGNYRWSTPHDALALWLRQGAPEMIEDFAAGRRNVICTACRPPKQ